MAASDGEQASAEHTLHGCLLKIGTRDGRLLVPKMPKALRKASGKEERPKSSKEKAQQPPPSGWRKVTLQMNSEGRLFVFGDENVLLKAITLSPLRMTDIRPVDPSLHTLPHVLSIQTRSLSIPSPSPMSPATTNFRSPSTPPRGSPNGKGYPGLGLDEPLQLAFPTRRAMLAWLALTRSWAKAEVYQAGGDGDAGYYRVHRQVHLTVIELRTVTAKHEHMPSLGSVTSLDDASGSVSPTTSSAAPSLQRRSSSSLHDLAVDSSSAEWICEIWDSTGPCFRTSLKKGSAPFWREECHLQDLPQLSALTIRVSRAPASKAALASFGVVQIPLKTYRRGADVETWFSIMGSDEAYESSVKGELRLRVRVDEDIVLPRAHYDELVTLLHGSEKSAVIEAIAPRCPSLENLADGLVHLYASDSELLINVINELAMHEIWSERADENTIFRPNTILTKMIDRYMSFASRQSGWLEASLGAPVRNIIEKRVECELDTDRKGGPADTEELLRWVDVVFESIHEARTQCPTELRRIFQHIRSQCNQRWGKAQLVNSFLFLRLFVPAIINPNLFGLTVVSPPPAVGRTLTLIAKIIQALANEKEDLGDKEHFMGVVSPFLRNSDRKFAFMDYVAYVGDSTSAPSTTTARDAAIAKKADAINADIDARYSSVSSRIFRESILCPHSGLDVSRDLAAFAAFVVRVEEEASLTSDEALSIASEEVRETIGQLVRVCAELHEEAQARWESGQRAARVRCVEPDLSELRRPSAPDLAFVPVNDSSGDFSPPGTPSSSPPATSSVNLFSRRRGFTVTGAGSQRLRGPFADFAPPTVITTVAFSGGRSSDEEDEVIARRSSLEAGTSATPDTTSDRASGTGSLRERSSGGSKPAIPEEFMSGVPMPTTIISTGGEYGPRSQDDIGLSGGRKKSGFLAKWSNKLG